MSTEAIDTETTASEPTDGLVPSRRWSAPVAVSLAAGLLGSALIFILGDPLGDGPSGTSTGAEVSQALIDHEMILRAVAWLAALACAGLVLAAVRLGRAAGDTSGRVISAAGSAAAVVMLGYYASFAAGAAVATYNLSEAGPGLGEATLVVLNAFSLTLVGPALALVGAVAVTPGLPRAARVTGALLAVALLVPFTTWIANLLLPLWLGTVGATVRSDAR